MKNNLEDIVIRYNKLKSDLEHGGYSSEYKTLHILGQLIHELIPLLETQDDIFIALRNIYFLGETNGQFKT